MYDDNHTKFAAVLNGRHPLPTRVNALGHLTAGLASQLPQAAADYLEYPCPAGGFSSVLSRYPYIVLAAKNSNQLLVLAAAASEAGLPCNVFATTMLGHSAEHQRAQTLAVASDDLDLVGVVLFGPAEEVNLLTKRFSLLKDPTAQEDR